jgi:hypothetical protein
VNRKQALTLAVLLLSSVSVFAQNVATPKKEAIEQLLQAMSARDIVRAAFNALIMSEEGEPDPPDPSLSDEERRNYEKAVEAQLKDTEKYHDQIFAKIDAARFARDVYGPVFEKNFSTEEIAELTTFFKTAVGKKSAAALPALIAGTGRATGRLREEISRAAAELQREDLKKNPWKTTMNDMRALGSAISDYAIEMNEYPKTDFAGLLALLKERYGYTFPDRDVWGTGLIYESDGSHWRLISAGADRQLDEALPALDAPAKSRQTETLEDDIIYQDSLFIQSPAPAGTR